MNIELETRFFKWLILDGRAERFTDRLANPKRRHKIWEDLRDTRYFDKRSLTRVEGNEKEAAAILAQLKNAGCSDKMYLLSPNEELDGSEALLREVLSTIWEEEEILGFCPNSECGFFKSHEHDFWILQRHGK